ncbi:MAG: HAD-IIIC family phosphatase [Candidatus Scalindua sp.]|nr:HAD-IIIC family phosphatase [Candidatus Scalindua sp.]
MNKNTTYKSILISDFTINNLAGYLDNDMGFPEVKTVISPYGQVAQVLIDSNLECWQNPLDLAVVWTRPEAVIESFNQLMDYRYPSLDIILAEVDEYASLLMELRDRLKFIFVPMWVVPSFHRGLGLLEMKDGIGMANTLMHMNLRLIKRLSEASNMYVLNTQRWIAIAGKNAFNPKLWYLGKIAFGNEVFKEAVKDIKSAINGIGGNSRKLVVLDLDDTLWGGVVGDSGWENVKLGGHDVIGEAYLDFQHALKSLTNRGILLAIASKNEEKTALEAINNHPEMVLTLKDFAGWKINWQDKVQNIIDLVSDLGIGLQSAIFIDDNPVERERVREALPEVFVPEWPNTPILYKSALLSLNCFDVPSITNEDQHRTKMYISQRERENLKERIGTVDEWLQNLGIKICVEEMNTSNTQRILQLLNKTNQMNLSTRRMTELELMNWLKEPERKFWAFCVRDRFGDSGLTGIVSIEVQGKMAKIVDFVLSCRVIGRKIEECILYTAIEYAKSKGLDTIYAVYVQTEKNNLCLRFFQTSGFKKSKGYNFSWALADDYRIPHYIEMQSS